MNRQSYKIWALRLSVVIAILVTFVLSGRTQQGGNGSAVMGNADDLINDQPIPGGLGSYGFGTGVGGLAFGAVAVSSRIDLWLVALEYHPELPDGSRLVAIVEDGGVLRSVVVDAPDWVLVPTARYASSGQHAAMTLFGKMKDPNDDAWMRANGYDIINFERSLKDTLLGLRLFQADVLILAAASADLPRTSQGYLLGWGEQEPNPSVNVEALDQLWSSIASYGDQPFQSYIITDRGEGIRFDASTTQLSLQGAPYWYCWREVPMSAEARSALWQAAEAYANDALNAEELAAWEDLGPDAFDALYTDSYAQERFDAHFDLYISPRLMQALPELSDKISSTIEALGGINPAVYRALTQTMQLAALFRRAIANDPEQFAILMQSLANVVPAPCLRSPAGYAPHSPLMLPDAVLSCPQPETVSGGGEAGAGGGSNVGGGNGIGGAAGVGGGDSNGSNTQSGGDTATGATQPAASVAGAGSTSTPFADAGYPSGSAGFYPSPSTSSQAAGASASTVADSAPSSGGANTQAVATSSGGSAGAPDASSSDLPAAGADQDTNVALSASVPSPSPTKQVEPRNSGGAAGRLSKSQGTTLASPDESGCNCKLVASNSRHRTHGLSLAWLLGLLVLRRVNRRRTGP